MTKVGSIEINVYDHFNPVQMQEFATRQGITLHQAESLAREMLYRREYNRRRSALPAVKASRKVYNNKRREQLRELKNVR
jgi:hypothetical protein